MDMAVAEPAATGGGRGADPELEALGPLSVRAAVGHGARGLLAGRRLLGLFSPRPGPAAAPTAGARTACWGSPTANAGCVSPRPCGTGAMPCSRNGLFGLTGAEGNHGEDRQRRVFLSGLDADAFPICGRATTIRRSRFRMPGWWRKTGGAAGWSPSLSWPTPACWMTAAISRSPPSTPRPPLMTCCIRLTVRNCGPAAAVLHLLPTVWFRNTWSWGCWHEGCTLKPRIVRHGDRLLMTHETLGEFSLRFAPPGGWHAAAAAVHGE